MKKQILFLIMVLGTVIVFGQEPVASDTVVTIPGDPGGFWGFYNKYQEAIWLILGMVGVTAFLQYRFGKLKAAFDEIVLAAQDGRISEAEFQAIVKALKEIWKPKSKTN